YPLFQDSSGSWAFAAPRTFQAPPAGDGIIRSVDSSGTTQVDLVDLNGDGLLDHVFTASEPGGGESWRVFFGTGFGFVPIPDGYNVWAGGDDPNIQGIANGYKPDGSGWED